MWTYVIGCSDYADIVVSHESVKPRHAELTITGDGRYFITDCMTGAGSWIGQPEGVTREEDWIPIRQGFVEQGALLRLGEYICRLSILLDSLKIRSHADSPQDSKRTSGPVERDPVTGEIIPRELKHGLSGSRF